MSPGAKPNDDFIDLESALRELKLKEEELRHIISDGDLRAFRDGDSMKFRREDIERFKEKVLAEDTIPELPPGTEQIMDLGQLFFDQKSGTFRPNN